MFKAKIIKDSSYWTIRRKILITGLFLMPLFFLTVGEHKFSFYFGVLYYVTLVVLTFLYRRWYIKLENSLGPETIVLDLGSITVLNAHKEELIEFIPGIMDNVILKTNFKLDQEKSANDILNEIKGNIQKHSITIIKEDSVFEYFFVIDSHYMIVQLQKVISHWRNQNVNVSIETNRS